ncbi:MAG: hypothetical protein IPK07_19615 [Deltaproteobacteria bacterium]|nr:hypothetical protein [Deltaproteobacteria bacterium]
MDSALGDPRVGDRGALRDDVQVRYWCVALGSSFLCALGEGLSSGDPGPPGNSPLALAVAFIFFPMMLTFLVERAALRRARPAVAALLAVPVGLASFAAGVFVAMTISVNAGILSP